jgi:hypothetical protein
VQLHTPSLSFVESSMPQDVSLHQHPSALTHLPHTPLCRLNVSRQGLLGAVGLKVAGLKDLREKHEAKTMCGA